MLTPAAFWDREATSPVAPPSHHWMAHPLVREYINESISRGEAMWPLDWFQSRYPRRRFRRALSIGCGTGPLERDLLRRNVVDRIDACDASTKSLEVARDAAAAEGLSDRVHYYEADFNALELPARTYDFICFHQSLHHVTALEHLFVQVERALTDDGLLYLDEYIGPSRDYWNAYRIRWYRALYAFFPPAQRHFETFAMPVQEDDPSEAIRSGEIVSRLSVAFSIEEFRGYGGNLLAMLFPDLRVPELTDDQVRTMIAAERALLASGEPPFHAVIVARKKLAPRARAVARVRYALEGRFPRATGRARTLMRVLRNEFRSAVAKPPLSRG